MCFNNNSTSYLELVTLTSKLNGSREKLPDVQKSKLPFKDEACTFEELNKGIINPECPKCIEKWCKFLDNQKGEGKPVRVVY